MSHGLEPILRDFPEAFESERLLIRAPRPGDGPAVHEAIGESLDELRRWMPWANEHQSVEVSEAYCRRAHAEFLARRELSLFLFRRDDGTFVGGSGLHRIDWTVPRFEIGYWVRTARAGQGYATEAAHRICDFAFDDLDAERVEIWCDVRNERSAAVARRRLHARVARRAGAPGHLRPAVGLALLRPPSRLIGRAPGRPPPGNSACTERTQLRRSVPDVRRAHVSGGHRPAETRGRAPTAHVHQHAADAS